MTTTPNRFIATPENIIMRTITYTISDAIICYIWYIIPHVDLNSITVVAINYARYQNRFWEDDVQKRIYLDIDPIDIQSKTV